MPFFGIDLGTTHTVMVEVTHNKGIVEYKPVPLTDFRNGSSNERSILLPSVVYFRENDTPIVGTFAKEMLTVNPERVFLNTKVNLGAVLQSGVRQASHTPQQVSEEILKKCFEELPDGAQVRISVPAAFDNSKKQETKNAVERAMSRVDKKIKYLGLTEEPYAAMLNLIFLEDIDKEQFNKEKNIMIIDIGGGTLDIMIPKIIFDQEKKAITVKGWYNKANHDAFAGAKFDHEIMQNLKTQFFKQYNLSSQVFLSKNEEAILEKVLLYYAEAAKKYLCDPQNAGRDYQFTLDPDEIPALSFLSNVVQAPFKISIKKTEMDCWLKDKLYDNGTYMENGCSIQGILNSALRNNGLSRIDIDMVYLTGGMAKYDKIAEVIRNTLHIRNVMVASEPLLCTAKGVAIHAKLSMMGKVINVVGGKIPGPIPKPIFDDKVNSDSNKNQTAKKWNIRIILKIFFLIKHWKKAILLA